MKQNYQKLALIPGNCLFPSHESLSPDQDTLFFMAEDAGLCTHFTYHKHKLVLFLSAMRSHAAWIDKSWPIKYWKLEEENFSMTYEAKINATLKAYPSINTLITYDLEDQFFENRIMDLCKQQGVKLTIVDSPGFITTKADFKTYTRQNKKPFMHTFYKWQRKRLHILVDETGQPLHDKWSFDEENRKKLPKGIVIPPLPVPAPTKHTEAVKELVNHYFQDHPGKTDNFHWYTTRSGVLEGLEHFFSERFARFGPYEDAIDKTGVFLFHAVMSPYINMGLITPQEVVEKALDYAKQHEIHFPSVEGFVRQLIGWREFMRGVYHHYPLKGNFFDHKRKMKPCWYEGTTGLPPLDDSIKKAIKHGYTHHIERLMVLGNLMLLCEIDPDDVYRWFMEHFVDSADWVMVPNVYGMSQFADGGIFATKPYIAGANYIAKMSNYGKTGEWVETMNGLYWYFIHNHLSVFAGNQRMSMMVAMLNKMDSDKKNRYFDRAAAFIEQVTFT